MYTKKVILTAIDEYLYALGSMEYAMSGLSSDYVKEYYKTKLVDLCIVNDELVDMISHLENELCVTLQVSSRWKTIGDICNAFRLKIEKNKD